MSLVLLESEDVAWFRDDLNAARGVASRLARRIGLGEHRVGEAVLAVSEAASNLAKHAVSGAIVLRIVRTEQHIGLEFLALDDGPGMADVAASMRDGRSTAGTLGIGLGMITRLADTFDLHSIPGQGTVMLARFWPRDSRLRRPSARHASPESVVAGVTRCISGAQTVEDGRPACGDGWAARWDTAETPAPAPWPAPHDAVPDARTSAQGRTVPRPDRLAAAPVSTALGVGRAVLVMLCDGLGHGPLAEIATQAAIRAIRTGRSRSPEEVMTDIHQALAGTRGAAVAVARIEPDCRRVLFCGVGNIAAAIVTPTSKTSLASQPGIVGHRIPILRTTTHPLPAGSTWVMHSDGLTQRWNPQDLPGLLEHTPPVIAGHLLRTAGKHHDDASILVAKGMW
ncbi:ATP-binding protein [Streptomyces albipurpureus]|uniref:ATP-binding protein n=1 Tax=Streptomyces albipurpureus TaxID=2897419 RepID=A0ABT0UHK4_9ACTN|nr:ATP-binding SpoIIE family protein phosphatase [Streptomyces sp. CWNU-1]MCM2388107.1 ATP-binding protein [Streptomyces sp. CWNU-1]